MPSFNLSEVFLFRGARKIRDKDASACAVAPDKSATDHSQTSQKQWHEPKRGKCSVEEWRFGRKREWRGLRGEDSAYPTDNDEAGRRAPLKWKNASPNSSGTGTNFRITLFCSSSWSSQIHNTLFLWDWCKDYWCFDDWIECSIYLDIDCRVLVVCGMSGVKTLLPGTGMKAGK